MKRLLSTVVAGAIFATAVAVPVTPAFADRKRDQYIENFYKKHPRDDRYYRWQQNRHGWRDDDYRGWYRHYHRDNDNDALAVGLFGLAAGAIVGGAIANSGGGVYVGSHVDACAARYRSYDPSSDTYLGYDGLRHPCRL